MNPDIIRYLYTLTLRVLKTNLDGIRDEESRQELPGGTSVNWIVGHVLLSRSNLLAQLGAERHHDSTLLQFYQPAHDAPNRTGQQMSLDSLVHELETHHQQFVELLTSIVEEATEERRSELYKEMCFFHFHESYHTGQIGVLRRILGKEGKIR